MRAYIARKEASQMNEEKREEASQSSSAEKIRPQLAEQVREVLLQNKQERHMRGGEATKLKYMQLKNQDK